MKWLTAKRFYLKKKPRDTDTGRVRIPDPMRSNRMPYSYQYPYSYGSPYGSNGSKEYYNSSGDGAGGTIRMDPEQNVGLGLGKRPGE